MKTWSKYFPIIVALPLIITGCAPAQRTYNAPSGNLLTLEVLSAQRVGTEQAKVSVCYELPSDADWVLGRLPGDVTLSDGEGTAAMDHFELLATSDDPRRRCDQLFFSRLGGFPLGAYSLTILRLAATIPEQPDWAALQTALADTAPSLVIEQLPDQTGLSFGLVAKPMGMTDAEAADLVVGLAEPVLIGPWSVQVEIEK